MSRWPRKSPRQKSTAKLDDETAALLAAITQDADAVIAQADAEIEATEAVLV